MSTADFHSTFGDPVYKTSATELNDHDEQMWLAVTCRDGSFDGVFIFAVKTTGIYCRPSCPSRRPKRQNVIFYGLNDEAEAAGFRPCKRCRPRETSIAQDHYTAIERVCREIEASPEARSLKKLAGKVNMSPSYLHRIFKRITGTTPRAYSKALSEKRTAVELSASKNRTVTEAVFAAGYNSMSRFYEGAEDRLGMAPRKFLQGGSGADIYFGFAQSGLGLLLVAATNKGICRVRFGDDCDLLEQELRADFPNATVRKVAKGFERLLDVAVRSVDQPAEAEELPLDIQGTLFEQKVWVALRTIPLGETRSYSDIAQQVGKPKAVSVVARACAANPVALLDPSHRVTAKAGDLSGY